MCSMKKLKGKNQSKMTSIDFNLNICSIFITFINKFCWIIYFTLLIVSVEYLIYNKRKELDVKLAEGEIKKA